MASTSPAELSLQPKRPSRSPTWRQMVLLNRISNAYQLELKRLSMIPPDDTQTSDKGESPKNAHTRRREQVRRAQRKHRERKETYIKSLEQQVLQLLRQQTTVAAQKKAVQEENAMLKGLLEQHDIPIPGEAFGYGPAAKVSVHEVPGGFQRLQVTMPEPAPDYFADFDHSHSPRPRETSSPESIDVDVPAYLGSGHSSVQRGVPSAPPPAFRTRLPSGSVQIHPLPSPQTTTTTTTADGLSALPPSTSGQPIPHPDGLDAAQIGIDFVLALEHPCLSHTKNDLQSPESYGHILTIAAPLLTHAPQPIQPASSWSIPASEIERLLNLSSQLNLAGELTPVQAWSRIRSYPGFEKLNLDQLETLKQALLKEVQCYGFGAVMDESAFDQVLRQSFYGL